VKKCEDAQETLEVNPSLLPSPGVLVCFCLLLQYCCCRPQYSTVLYYCRLLVPPAAAVRGGSCGEAALLA